MNNLKKQILTYKVLRKIFSLICVIGIAGFIFFSLGENNNIIRNGWISIALMLFGLVEADYCNFRVRELKKEYFKFKRNFKGKTKIIDFEKIA